MGQQRKKGVAAEEKAFSASGIDDTNLRRRKSERNQDSGPPVITSAAIKALQHERMRALDSDNFYSTKGPVAEETFEIGDDDDAIALSPSARRRKKKQKLKRKVVKPLAVIVQEAEYDQWPPHIPNYTTVGVGAETMPARQFCSVCGYVHQGIITQLYRRVTDGFCCRFFAPLKCPRCAMRYCSEKCRAAHLDTRCLKFVG
eukprot:TRINITY_DN1636_c0_g1_i2.p1 TRINITY_DN1636_c0_g1~~TRINITY_DN1636_c0_g1_i2.p1  ORF type:complete len:201 (-),score=27.46 TRINITY_DN1636_c0_g1_i2:66-668(-)